MCCIEESKRRNKSSRQSGYVGGLLLNAVGAMIKGKSTTDAWAQGLKAHHREFDIQQYATRPLVDSCCQICVVIPPILLAHPRGTWATPLS